MVPGCARPDPPEDVVSNVWQSGPTLPQPLTNNAVADNPYNYTGVGYDGVPSTPLRQVLAYAPGLDSWRWLPAPPVASMDHRNAGVAGGRVFLAGGMVENQRVSDQVWYVEVVDLLRGPSQ